MTFCMQDAPPIPLTIKRNNLRVQLCLIFFHNVLFKQQPFEFLITLAINPETNLL